MFTHQYFKDKIEEQIPNLKMCGAFLITTTS